MVPQDTRESTVVQSETSTSLIFNLDSEEKRSPVIFSLPTDNKQDTETSGNMTTNGKKKRKINKFDSFSTEAELRIEKMKYSISLEKELGEMRKEQEQLKIKLLKQQLETAVSDEIFLKEKRELELLVIKNKIN